MRDVVVSAPMALAERIEREAFGVHIGLGFLQTFKRQHILKRLENSRRHWRI